MDTRLTITEIARHFSIPESTARYYCKRFAPFLPIFGEGRRKRYGEKSIQIIASIIEFMRQGKTAAVVEEELAAHFPRIMEVHVESRTGSAPSTVSQQRNSSEENASCQDLAPHTAYVELQPSPRHSEVDVTHTAGSQHVLHLLEQQTSAMQSIAQSLSILATQKEDMQRLEDAARTSKEENTMLREEVYVLQTLLHSSEKVHQDDLDQVRSWMSRLAKSYNDKNTMEEQAPKKDPEKG